jgi:hypothetical protein
MNSLRVRPAVRYLAKAPSPMRLRLQKNIEIRDKYFAIRPRLQAVPVVVSKATTSTLPPTAPRLEPKVRMHRIGDSACFQMQFTKFLASRRWLL